MPHEGKDIKYTYIQAYIMNYLMEKENNSNMFYILLSTQSYGLCFAKLIIIFIEFFLINLKNLNFI